METHWSLWIITLTVVNLALVLWVLLANRKVAISDDDDPENRTTGHVYDGIEEYDNPLPRWWFNLFIITMVFAVGYLIFYPGLGSYKGVLGWTSHGEVEADVAEAEAQFKELFGTYAAMPIEDLIDDPRAMKTAQRLFSNNCAICHGAGAGGAFGFPNLTDNDWLHGGTPAKIEETITKGRRGAMPAWGQQLGREGVANVAEYVLSLSGQVHDEAMAQEGGVIFKTYCASCHGADGKGQYAFGAPNLTDDIWLYYDESQGDLRNAIEQTVRNGRTNVMPSQGDKLAAEKIHLLAAFIYKQSLEGL